MKVVIAVLSVLLLVNFGYSADTTVTQDFETKMGIEVSK